MDLKDLIEQLDQRYGNPYMTKEYALIQEATKVLQLQSEEIHALHKEIAELQAK
jgi:hypothetical protein